MNQLQRFTFEQAFPFRAITIDGEPWFVAKDVCEALGLSDTSGPVSRLDNDERGTAIIGTPSGDQQMLTINESGLYSLILTSSKPAAKRLKKWVTSEVLPSIRKTGSYQLQPKTFAESLRAYADQVEQNERLKVELIIAAPKIELADAIAERAEEHSITSAGKEFGMGSREIHEFLHQRKCITKREYYDGSPMFWEPNQHMIEYGYMAIRLVPDKYGTPRRQPKFTGKGITYLAKLVASRNTTE